MVQNLRSLSLKDFRNYISNIELFRYNYMRRERGQTDLKETLMGHFYLENESSKPSFIKAYFYTNEVFKTNKSDLQVFFCF